MWPGTSTPSAPALAANVPLQFELEPAAIVIKRSTRRPARPPSPSRVPSTFAFAPAISAMPPKKSAMQRQNKNSGMAMTVAMQMREENWMVRHEWFKRLRRMYPIMCEYVLDMMGPDELLYGRSTGKHVVPGAIKLHNKKKRQTILTEHGFVIIKIIKKRSK